MQRVEDVGIVHVLDPIQERHTSMPPIPTVVSIRVSRASREV
jgi:hypothetical protein